MGRLSERVAIVTGGVGGIGSAVARLLSAEGATVVVADVRDAEERASRRNSAAGRATWIWTSAARTTGSGRWPRWNATWARSRCW